MTQADGSPAVGAIVANEVLDALPVHRVIGRPGGLREQLVGLDVAGAFAVGRGGADDKRLAQRLRDEGVELEDGQAAELCLGIETWLAGAVDGLDRGVVVLIDYAEEPGSLYAPRRRDGTLRGFARHGVGGDPFRHLGRQDLTATVDLAAVRDAAARAGLVPSNTWRCPGRWPGDGLAAGRFPYCFLLVLVLLGPGAISIDALIAPSTSAIATLPAAERFPGACPSHGAAAPSLRSAERTP